MDFAQNGNVSRFTPDDIADAVEWPDASKDFVACMEQAGFIEDSEDGLMIHDWYDYAGRLIEKREQNRERKRRSREKPAVVSDSHTPVTRPSRGRPDDGQMSHRATVPNLTVPNHTEPKRDKEEENSPPAPPQGECEKAFDLWYSVYPKTGSVRKAAFTKWQSLWKAKKIDMGEMMNGTEAYIAFQQHNGYSTCGAQVFLNQERWKDDWTIVEVVRPQQGQQQSQYGRTKSRLEQIMWEEMQHGQAGGG